MADPPENLAELDSELKQLLKAGEFLDALDICEEIEGMDAMEVRHWLAMARCLVELRRKADARRAWTRALELDPDQKEAIEGMNKYFPGWRTQAARSARESARPAAAPRRRPAPPVGPPGAETMVSHPPAARAAEPAPSPRPAPPVSRPAPAAPPVAPTSAPTAGPTPDAAVNWGYVMQDVADAEADRATR